MLHSEGARNGVRIVLAFLALSVGLHAAAQVDTQPTEGIRENPPRLHALTNARVVVGPGVELESATVVVRDGLIEAVGTDIEAPAGARVWDLDGRIVYPGFIDPMSELGLPAALRAPRPRGPDDGPPPPAPEQAADGFWNPRIRPETDISALLELDEDAIEELRSLGFTAALAVPRRGILRGQSALVSLAEPENARESLIAARVAQHFGAETSGADDSYPSSLMGVVALVRQAFYDAEWYRDATDFNEQNPAVERAAVNSALAALHPVLSSDQALIYSADDELDYARALALADEFDLELALYGNGYEYRRLDLLQALEQPLIVPLDFPDAPAIDTPDGALAVSLETLQHFELAPSNPAFLADAGISFALTADGLDNVGESFWEKVRLVGERGLSSDQTLAALTTVPAELLGVSDRLGTIESGKIANLVIADADLFTDEEAGIELVFVDGEAYEQSGYRAVEIEGRWTVSWPAGVSEWSISERGPRLTLTIDGENYRGRRDGDQLVLFPAASLFGAGDGIARFSGFLTDAAIDGIAELPDGETFSWQAEFVGPADEAAAEDDAVAVADDQAADDDDVDVPALIFPAYPAGAYGLVDSPPQAESLLVRGATIWTSGPAGRLENADLLIRAGRIEAVGRNLQAPRDAVVIDAAGKHVTAGLVDAHSHTAISRGTNEVGSAITIEVRIADVLDPTDINIYRQLAGGLTTANIMHGSANPMGGQIQTIKLRWGENASGLLFDGAPSGVKFALGENVKQSNWGDDYTTRYPQSRMGVDEIIRDTFDAALAYREAKDNTGRNDPPLRRNLRLDAALEMLDRERRIHIHSYRQDEILAFVRLAEEYSLNVAAFQHVLEGYKVGPEIASIGAGGSTFSDWWGYKYEVIDAIPYNGALMREAGVVVSFNSDDGELATRLNTEAAKGVKYGNVPEEDAFNFVTINPAIQLGVDDRIGSLEAGKDADFVIWSGDPLSTFSRAEQTWIDGRKYFDIETDAAMRAAAAAERSRLIQKILDEQIGDDGPDSDNPGSSGETDEISAEDFTSDLYSSVVQRSHARGESNE